MNRKKAIITKDKSLTSGGKGKQEDDQYQKPGGVKKISNSVVSGRSTGSMSYDPQVNVSAGLLFRTSALSALSFLVAFVKLDPDLRLSILGAATSSYPHITKANLDQRTKQKSDRFCMVGVGLG
jgi:hypothetical protein